MEQENFQESCENSAGFVETKFGTPKKSMLCLLQKDAQKI